MTSQVENLRQTYNRTYDNLMTSSKIFFCNLAPDRTNHDQNKCGATSKPPPPDVRIMIRTSVAPPVSPAASINFTAVKFFRGEETSGTPVFRMAQ